jgi:DNA-binding HxlR family transcriptional regulator
MPRLKQQPEVCSVARALQLIGDRWTLLIIRDAFYGVSRFQDFHESIGLAKNVLSDRLNKLIEGGVMEAVPVGEGAWNAYRLTAMGRDLLPTLVALMQWGDRWVNQPDRIPVQIVARDTNQPVAPVEIRGVDGESLGIDDMAIRPGPGVRHPDAQRQLKVYARARQREKANPS